MGLPRVTRAAGEKSRHTINRDLSRSLCSGTATAFTLPRVTRAAGEKSQHTINRDLSPSSSASPPNSTSAVAQPLHSPFHALLARPVRKSQHLTPASYLLPVSPTDVVSVWPIQGPTQSKLRKPRANSLVRLAHCNATSL
jgi:hypothetical protein